jgi:hypothetical protein
MIKTMRIIALYTFILTESRKGRNDNNKSDALYWFANFYHAS